MCGWRRYTGGIVSARILQEIKKRLKDLWKERKKRGEDDNNEQEKEEKEAAQKEVNNIALANVFDLMVGTSTGER